jgi:hypothetical protein
LESTAGQKHAKDFIQGLSAKITGLLTLYKTQLRKMAGPLIGHYQFERASLEKGTGK